MAIQKIDKKTYAFGKHLSHVLIWDVICKEAGHTLLLCREIICLKKYGETNSWKASALRCWLNSDFLSSFNKEEKDRIVIKNDDSFFLLSAEEYDLYKENISNPHRTWWMRSPCPSADYALIVGWDGDIECESYCRDDGVRPAVWMDLPIENAEKPQQSDTEYYITNVRRCTHPGGFEYEAEPVHETKKFYCDDEKITEKLWEVVRGENRPVRLSFDKTTNNNNDLKRLIDIYD